MLKKTVRKREKWEINTENAQMKQMRRRKGGYVCVREGLFSDPPAVSCRAECHTLMFCQMNWQRSTQHSSYISEYLSCTLLYVITERIKCPLQKLKKRLSTYDSNVHSKISLAHQRLVCDGIYNSFFFQICNHKKCHAGTTINCWLRHRLYLKKQTSIC